MTNPIEAARAALDQYTAALDFAKVHYLAAVAEASGVPVDELPTCDETLPVYLGEVKDIPDSAAEIFHAAAHNESVKFVYVSEPTYLWVCSGFRVGTYHRDKDDAAKTYWNNHRLFKTDDRDTLTWLKTAQTKSDSKALFAFFPDHADAAPFLDKLAALQTPAPVVEVVGTLDSLTPGWIKSECSNGALFGILFNDTNGNSWNWLWQHTDGRWHSSVTENMPHVADPRASPIFDGNVLFMDAYARWIRGYRGDMEVHRFERLT